MVYLRLPSVAGNRVVFTSEDDIWLAEWDKPAESARRVTNDHCAYGGVLSPCGSMMAYSSDATGECEAYVLRLPHGAPVSLTSLGMTTEVVSWTPDASCVILCSNARQAHENYCELYYAEISVGADGTLTASAPSPLGLGHAHTLSFDLHGGPGFIVGRHTADPATAEWKGYRGGRTPMLWHSASGRLEDLLPLTLPLANHGPPFLLGDRVIVVAEGETLGECANLFLVPLDGSPATQLTHHADYFARHATCDGTSVIYQLGGRLYQLALSSLPVEHASVTYEVPSDAVATAGTVLRPSRALDILCATSDLQVKSYTVDPLDCASTLRLHPDGHSILMVTRGVCFAVPLWEGPACPLQTPLLPDGSQPAVLAADFFCDQRVVMVTAGEPGGPCRLVAEVLPDDVFSAATELIAVDDASAAALHGQPLCLATSPTEAALAMATDTNRLVVVVFTPPPAPVRVRTPRRNRQRAVDELAAGHRPPLPTAVARVVDVSRHEQGFSDVTWSLDGQWIAYVCSTSESTAVIRIRHWCATTPSIDVTSGVFLDSCPRFSREGNYLYFLSSRDFEPVVDTVQTGMSFPATARPYVVGLTATAPNPLQQPPRAPGAQSDDNGESDAGDYGDEDDDDSDDDADSDEVNARDALAMRAFGAESLPARDTRDGVWATQVEPDGLFDRVAVLPVATGIYSSLCVLEGDTLMYVRSDPHSEVEREANGAADDAAEPVGDLHAFRMKQKREVLLFCDVEDVSISRDGHNMLLMCSEDDGMCLRVFEAGVTPPETNDDEEEVDFEQPGPESGLVPLASRLVLNVDPLAEWTMVLREAWAALKRLFWDEKLNGVDWPQKLQLYLPLVQHVRSRSEFDDVLQEMVTELRTSHLYHTGGEASPNFARGSPRSQGTLGATFEWDAVENGYRTLSLVKGDCWRAAGGPLAKMGLDVRPGDILLAINHQRLSEALHPDMLLANLADREISITMRRPPAQSTAQSSPAHASSLVATTPPWLKYAAVARARVAQLDASAAEGAVVPQADTVDPLPSPGGSTGKKKKNRKKKTSRGGDETGPATGSVSSWLVGTSMANERLDSSSSSVTSSRRSRGGAGGRFGAGGGGGPDADSDSGTVPVGSASRIAAQRRRHARRSPYASGGMLTLLQPGVEVGSAPRALRVKPITPRSLTASRYRDWVHDQQKAVHAATQQRIGYVHVPELEEVGYGEFHRYYLVESQKDGLILDIRWNEGGFVSELLAEKLSRTVLGYDINRYCTPVQFPSHAVNGPVVLLVDENTSSDGDVLANTFRQMKRGTIVGKRTWGGVIGMEDHDLRDGTRLSVPSGAYYALDEGYHLENHGIQPDVEVDFGPLDYLHGRDPQLEKALEIIKEQLQARPPQPDFSQTPYYTATAAHVPRSTGV